MNEKLLACFRNREIVEKLMGASILVTGATGLIGQTIVKSMLSANNVLNLDMKIYMFVRDKKKAERIFGNGDQNRHSLVYIEGDLLKGKIDILENIDYIIHGASITDSMEFVNRPIETINTGIIGTENVLYFSRKKQIRSFVYLSSMEVYGAITEKRKLKEDDVGYLNPLLVRSSYSESKRMIENICISFFSEYGIPVKIIRLAQTFGPGIKYEDSRVFAQFARCAIEKRDIVLYTTGASERMYLYSEDAVDAILTVLIKGEDGNVYNAGNEETYCSIRQMAELVKTKIANNEISVLIEESQEKAIQFSPEHYLYLDIEKLTGLGWKPATDLITSYKRLIEAMKKDRKFRV